MKRLFAGFAVALLILTAGCAQNPTQTDVTPTPDESVKADTVLTDSSTTVTTAKKTTTTKKKVVKTTVKNKQISSTTTKKKTKYISESKAKAIAFERAGVRAQEVTRLQIELDYDDDRRIWEYEIDFRVGKMEYDVCVNAVLGTVVSFEKEIDVD